MHNSLLSLLNRSQQVEDIEDSRYEKDRGWVCSHLHKTLFPSRVTFNTRYDWRAGQRIQIIPNSIMLPATFLTCSAEHCYEIIKRTVGKPPATFDAWSDPVDNAELSEGTILYLVGNHRPCDGIDNGVICAQSARRLSDGSLLARPHELHWFSGFKESRMTQGEYEQYRIEHPLQSSRHVS